LETVCVVRRARQWEERATGNDGNLNVQRRGKRVVLTGRDNWMQITPTPPCYPSFVALTLSKVSTTMRLGYIMRSLKGSEVCAGLSCDTLRKYSSCELFASSVACSKMAYRHFGFRGINSGSSGLLLNVFMWLRFRLFWFYSKLCFPFLDFVDNVAANKTCNVLVHVGSLRQGKNKFTHFELDIHGSVHHNTNIIEMTNKMQMCRTIYYSIVPWLLNMIRTIISFIIRSF
jgi:hypothetical protein